MFSIPESVLQRLAAVPNHNVVLHQPMMEEEEPSSPSTEPVTEDVPPSPNASSSSSFSVSEPSTHRRKRDTSDPPQEKETETNRHDVSREEKKRKGHGVGSNPSPPKGKAFVDVHETPRRGSAAQEALFSSSSVRSTEGRVAAGVGVVPLPSVAAASYDAVGCDEIRFRAAASPLHTSESPSEEEEEESSGRSSASDGVLAFTEDDDDDDDDIPTNEKQKKKRGKKMTEESRKPFSLHGASASHSRGCPASTRSTLVPSPPHKAEGQRAAAIEGDFDAVLQKSSREDRLAEKLRLAEKEPHPMRRRWSTPKDPSRDENEEEEEDEDEEGQFSSTRSTTSSLDRSHSGTRASDDEQEEEEEEEEEEEAPVVVPSGEGRIGFRARERLQGENASPRAGPRLPLPPRDGTMESAHDTAALPARLSSSFSPYSPRPPQTFRSIYFETHLSRPDAEAAAAAGLDPTPCHHTLLAFRLPTAPSTSSQKKKGMPRTTPDDAEDHPHASLPSVTIQGPCAVLGGVGGGKPKRGEMQLSGYYLGRHHHPHLSPHGSRGAPLSSSSSSSSFAPPPPSPPVILWSEKEKAVLHPTHTNFQLPPTPTPRRPLSSATVSTKGRQGATAISHARVPTTHGAASSPIADAIFVTEEEKEEAKRRAGGCGVCGASPWKTAVQTLSARSLFLSSSSTISSSSSSSDAASPVVELVYGPGRGGELFGCPTALAFGVPSESDTTTPPPEKNNEEEAEEEEEGKTKNGRPAPSPSHPHDPTTRIKEKKKEDTEEAIHAEEEDDVESIFGPIDWAWVHAVLDAWAITFGGADRLPSVALILHPFHPSHPSGGRKFYLKENLKKKKKKKKENAQHGGGGPDPTGQAEEREGNACIEIPHFISPHREPLVDRLVVERVVPEVVWNAGVGVPSSAALFAMHAASPSLPKTLPPPPPPIASSLSVAGRKKREGRGTSPPQKNEDEKEKKSVSENYPPPLTRGIVPSSYARFLPSVGQRMVAVVGSSGTGKSTLCRYLTNVLLSCQHARRNGGQRSPPPAAPSPVEPHQRAFRCVCEDNGVGEGVLWLDMDLGQPEFGMPGEIGLYLVRQPLFYASSSSSSSHGVGSRSRERSAGHPHHSLANVEPIQTFFVGSPMVSCPVTMSNAVAALCDLVLSLQLEHYTQSKRLSLLCANAAAASSPHRCLRNTAAAVLPVVINTHGWVLHTGRRSTMEVLRRLSPRVVVHLMRDEEPCWTSPLRERRGKDPATTEAENEEEERSGTSASSAPAMLPSFSGRYHAQRYAHYRPSSGLSLSAWRSLLLPPSPPPASLDHWSAMASAPWRSAALGLNDEVVKRRFLLRRPFPLSLPTAPKNDGHDDEKERRSGGTPPIASASSSSALFHVQLLSRLASARSKPLMGYAAVLAPSWEAAFPSPPLLLPTGAEDHPARTPARSPVSRGGKRRRPPPEEEEEEEEEEMGLLERGLTTVHQIPVRWDPVRVGGEGLTSPPSSSSSFTGSGGSRGRGPLKPSRNPLLAIDHRRQRWLSYFLPLLEHFHAKAGHATPKATTPRPHHASPSSIDHHEEMEEPRTTLLYAPLSTLRWIAIGQGDERLGVSRLRTLQGSSKARCVGAMLEHAVVAVQLGPVGRLVWNGESGSGSVKTKNKEEERQEESDRVEKRNGRTNVPCEAAGGGGTSPSFSSPEGPLLTSLSWWEKGFPVTCYGYVESTEAEMTPGDFRPSTASASLATTEEKHGEKGSGEAEVEASEGWIRIRVPLPPSVVRSLLTSSSTRDSPAGVAVAYSSELRAETSFLEWMHE